MELIRYWPIFALACLLSVVASTGLLILRREEWLPRDQEAAPSPAEPVVERLPGMSMEYSEWHFDVAGVEALGRKYRDGLAQLARDREAIAQERALLAAERQDLERLRAEIADLQRLIDETFLAVEQGEGANLKRLATIYAGMKAADAERVLREMEVKSVVKILAAMPEDVSSRILGEMAKGGQDATKRAAMLSEELRKLRHEPS